MERSSNCELCGRAVALLTQHHLIPRTEHKRKKKREGLRQEFLHTVIWICAPCHKNIHAVLSERELADQYHTLDKLRRFPAIKKFTTWVSKQADAPILVRRSKAKHQRKKQNL